jgi:integrase/recombinase XerD
MSNPTVSLTRRIDRRYYPVVFNKNGSIRPDVVLVGGVETPMTGGNFYLSWYVGRKATRVSVGLDATQAMNRKWKQQQALASGEQIAVQPKTAPGRETLVGAVQRYLKEIETTKSWKTLKVYRMSCDYFLESYSKTHVEDITREDMLAFSTFLRAKGLSDRTVSNRFSQTMIFLKWAGHKVPGLKANDRPTFVEQEVEVYEPEDLAQLWPACTPKEYLLFRTLQKTGLREGEAAHLMWRDISKARSMVKVSAKPMYNWKPKKNKERSIPIQADLLADLLAANSEATSLLVFPGPDGGPDTHMLRTLKDVAKRAGLDPDQFYLHKFRQTFGTTCCRNGIDIVTLQSWMGHSDLKSTMRYLRAAGGAAVQAKVEQVVWP